MLLRARGSDSIQSRGLPRAATILGGSVREGVQRTRMEEVDEVELHVERVATLDLGKASLVALCAGAARAEAGAGGCRRCASIRPRRWSCARWWRGFGSGGCSRGW